ncbi:MAG: Uma2 family endonuclease [Methylomonas sp.]|uniref:Uma2 family endonuclease n=1 Tax=Methylomonas sp. TaxID=418 RepID=UPI0025D62314|nr:Uma2 family endonuclease [Methylomonas sp.]MCK9608482.1 Uma2 family endonuclease [Methylomonas sp.]
MALDNLHDNIYLSEAEYLATKPVSKLKRENIDGRVYAMAGAGYNHNCISANMPGEFRNHLKGTPCTTFMADIKLRLGKDYVYPDVLVDCSKMSGDDYFSTSPVIIVEVLSRSTRKRIRLQHAWVPAIPAGTANFGLAETALIRIFFSYGGGWCLLKRLTE